MYDRITFQCQGNSFEIKGDERKNCKIKCNNLNIKRNIKTFFFNMKSP